MWTARFRHARSGTSSEGRFAYSGLKEAALSGAAELWELKGLGLSLVASRPAVWVFGSLLSDVFIAAEELLRVG